MNLYFTWSCANQRDPADSTQVKRQKKKTTDTQGKKSGHFTLIIEFVQYLGAYYYCCCCYSILRILCLSLLLFDELCNRKDFFLLTRLSTPEMRVPDGNENKASHFVRFFV